MHHLIMISGKEVSYVQRGVIVEWTYVDKNGVRHWDNAAMGISKEGHLSIGVLSQVYHEVSRYAKQLCDAGAHSIQHLIEFPGFEEIVPDHCCY